MKDNALEAGLAERKLAVTKEMIAAIRSRGCLANQLRFRGFLAYQLRFRGFLANPPLPRRDSC